MTALDLSSFVTTSDSNELREYKAEVKKVAEAYTKKHGWCGEVKRALRDLGISEEHPVTINATTSMGFVIKAKVLPSLLVDKTEMEQKEVVAKQIGALSLVGSNASATLAVTAETITSLELASTNISEATTGKTLLQTENGSMRYVWRRIGDGRVLHLFRLGDRGMRDIHYQTDRVVGSHLYNQSSLCDQASSAYKPIHDWDDVEEERDECVRCVARTNNWSLMPYVPDAQEIQRGIGRVLTA